ncbi:MAG: flavodoxin family protein [Spirochaetes bacterium]|nr:flavodoxin family protein [Spirochaetota bacterium]
MKLSILALSGSPVKEGNVELLLKKMADSVQGDDISTEIINLSRIDIQDCSHCNFCLNKQTPDRYCSIKDDLQEIYQKAEKADIIILSSPVYFMRTSAKMAALIDRFRVFVFGNIAGGRLKNKVGVSAAVAWARHGGLETTHLTHLYAFLTFEMIPVSVHHCISPLGASAVASPNGTGLFDKEIRHGVEQDLAGLHSAAAMMKRAVELARIIKKGSE